MPVNTHIYTKINIVLKTEHDNNNINSVFTLIIIPENNSGQILNKWSTICMIMQDHRN